MPIEQLSVVLPARNEAENLETVVRSVDRFCRTRFTHHEILVVDDGSDDGTEELLSRLRDECSSLRVLRHPRRQGYGAALRSGFRAVRLEHVLFLDADGQPVDGIKTRLDPPR